MNTKPPIPILRSFDEDKAREFYIEFLGFAVDWEYRCEENTPLYMQVSKDDCIIHISEHFGDCNPGATLRIEIDDLAAYCKELNAKKYKHAQPSIIQQQWGEDMPINDPFGNRLICRNPNLIFTVLNSGAA